MGFSNLKLPDGLQFWPDDAVDLPPEKVIELYNAGFAGAVKDPEEEAAFDAALMLYQGYSQSSDIMSNFDLEEHGKGKLSLLFPYALKQYPDCWPFPAQATGDCVGVASAGVSLILICVEVAKGIIDEVTGEIEGYPEVSETGRLQGVFAWEAAYGDRGHSGQGASCDRLANHMTGEGGMMLRQNYPHLGIDLTTYQPRLEIGWGGRGTPADVKKEANKHPIRRAVTVRGPQVHDQSRDLIARGSPLWICSSLGFSNQRDANGFSRRQGSWLHSWIVAGYDDRASTIDQYGHPLALAGHRWGKWNSGGRRVLGTDIEIPHGWWWFDARLLSSCSIIAVSGASGWKAQPLPDLGGTGVFG